MDIIPPPTKPPRGVKNAKETSGLLMTVIRTLSTSDSNEQRDQERTKLERDYKKSNQQLEQLVSIHHDDLTRVMNLFGRLSTLISYSKEKVHTSKENLTACKKLLTCRREELKKLWLESVEYKYTLQLLKDVESMKEVPSQLVNCFSQKDYLQATRLLISAINTSECTLKDVIGLHELRTELLFKRQELYTRLLKEMKEQIYEHSTHEVIVLKRQGSARNDSVDQHSPSAIHRAERKISVNTNQQRPRKLLDVTSSMKTKMQKNESVQYADDPEYVISNLIECVVLLDKSMIFLEDLKQSTQRELTSLTKRTTNELSYSDSPSILLEFLQVVMEQFKRVIDCHTLVLEGFKKKNFAAPVYDLQDVWLKMQAVLQLLLTQYLEDRDAKKVEPVAENAAIVPAEQYDVNSYFTRKKYHRTVKGSLFKFKNSAQNDGISKTYEKEAGKEKQLLCKPSPQHITQVFVLLTHFAEETELRISGTSEKPSRLSTFLNEFVSKVFLGKRHEDIVGKVNGNEKANTALPSKEPNGVVTNSTNPLLTALTTSIIYTHVQ